MFIIIILTTDSSHVFFIFFSKYDPWFQFRLRLKRRPMPKFGFGFVSKIIFGRTLVMNENKSVGRLLLLIVKFICVINVSVCMSLSTL